MRALGEVTQNIRNQGNHEVDVENIECDVAPMGHCEWKRAHRCENPTPPEFSEYYDGGWI